MDYVASNVVIEVAKENSEVLKAYANELRKVRD